MTTADQEGDLPFQPQQEGVRMPADHRHSQQPRNVSTRRIGRSMASMSRHEKTLVTGIIVGFVILHVVGGTMLHSPAGKPPTENAMPMHHGD
jgi:hypothetical protein